MRQRAETLIQQIPEIIHLNYLFSIPQEAEQDPVKKWPAIIFLHGAGERGDNLDFIKGYGIPKVVEERPDFPFITISPQCPVNTTWFDHIHALDALLVHAITRHPIDLSRIYLTGLSMGGYGVWYWSVLYPERFAALAPVCGGGSGMHGFPERVCALKEVPVWAFHGALDDVVPVSETMVLVDRLKNCGGNVRVTLYPDAGHDSWTPTYTNQELYDWFLEHKHQQPADE